ncbi:protein of unknown function [Fibrobacter sp. UWCM]|uniref:DUF748 domain-containing protein n=1 Tax=Fibrobacter sp. UWCM TaxID=1896208 RepID=UPI000913C47D|nr:DUF748 domain-containing protein [Fibrobacter sp. UWCM]SHG58392.1 protein of unknown function [Fibrobacter sp. UWCM]
MKKALKITGIVIAALLILVIAALKFAPGIVRGYIVNNSEDLIGRKVAIESISLDPFSFTLSIDSLAVFEKDGETPFVSFEKFRVNVDPFDMLTGTASVSEIYLKGLYARVLQHEDRFNFTDIIEFLAKGDSTALDSAAGVAAADSATAKADTASVDSAGMVNAAEIAEGLPFNISVKNIVFEKGNIIYQDTKVGSKIHLQDFSLNIPAVYLSNKQTDVGLSLKFADGGDLNVKVEANAATNDFKLDVNLKDFALACGKPYLNDFINYKDFTGTLSVAVNMAGNLNDILSSDIKGTVSLDSVVLTETSGRTLGVNHVGVGIGKANINENNYVVDSVVVDGAFAHLDLYKNGKTNIDVLLKKGSADEPDSAQLAADQQLVLGDAPDSTVTKAKEETAPAEKSKPLKAKINKLLLQNTKVSATDHSITRPFNYTVSGITVLGSNINYDTPCSINVKAAFPDGGSLNVKYKGALSNIGTMDAYVSVKNLALKHFSNYSHHYTGYPLSAGTLAFASENKIKDFELDSKNTIDIYNIDVADKDPNSNPEFMVPMKVGLYILKDKDDKIQFDIPVHGNLKDPQFSVGKIIWKTVMNLLIKVALSPLKIVGNLASTGAGAIGLDLGKNDEIIIDATAKTFTSEQYAKASKMTEALSKDKNLKLVFTQLYNVRKTTEAYRTVKLKTEYYKKTHGKENLTELDERAIAEMSDSDEGFVAYVKENGDKLDVKALRKELSTLAEGRNQDLLKVLSQQSGVTKKNIKVITAPANQLSSHRGKAMYKVTVDVQ